ncbi:hypothetical protein DSL72_008011 [Monilinia vaccinii-corymbosi]|uniref:Uncharacterized protein n=1 Tax=Monilinia vaccinii-corymbosi TaxID=61207 RepID=A0A8A3PJP8_9HELO|nr:hypothetical protein DSL72_008011 [Monilinia vaccinii-corymbosi]
MSRSRNSFFSSSSGTNDQKHTLLSREYDAHHDFNLRDLSSHSASRVTPSPPPEFYRDIRSPTSPGARTVSPRPVSEAGSLSKMKGDGKARGRRIQFAAPPPPIVGSVMGLGIGRGRMGMSMDGSGSPGLKGSLMREGRGLVGALKSSGSGVGGSGQIDNLLALERRERALQAELQMLLDAQGEGLLQGFGGGGGNGEERGESGSSTPTTRSLQRDRDRQGGRNRDSPHMRTVPIRQPKKKMIGLRGARKGLLRDMGELVDVKVGEGDLLEEEIKRREMCLTKTKDWKMRIEEVKREIGEFISADAPDTGITLDGDKHESSPGRSEEDREIAELRNEERAVENEIRETEDRLLQMKARRNWLGERIKESINRRESRLSSYRGALREVESEVQEFLTRPPVMVSISVGNEGFMTLPPKRRTLEMAEEWWSKEITSLRARKLEVEKEKRALEEGAKYWEDSMVTVMEFEDDLREKMKSGEVGDVEGLKRQIGKMNDVIKKLGDTAHVAEKKRWNLLVIAVGAELQAFKQGEEILRDALKALGGDIHDVDDNDNEGRQVAPHEERGHTEEISTSINDSTTDDGLTELETDLARQENRERREGLLVDGRASVDREDESDEEKHLKELLVDHEGF